MPQLECNGIGTGEKEEKMSKPNLFRYATSELSQDAFFAWLLAWADKSNAGTNLHECAKAFFNDLILDGCDWKVSSQSVVKIDKQHKHIDILCKIDDKYAVIIEDKTGTREHSNQLQRYAESVRVEGYKDENVVCIYLKTLDQSDLSNVEKANYKVIDRDKLLGFFRTQQVKESASENTILADFSEHLESIERSVCAYQTKPIGEWNRDQWVGFYGALQKRSKHSDAHWNYVANPSGGFLGFWWMGKKVDGGEVYLQLEETRACFKVSAYKKENADKLKWRWNKVFKDAGKAKGIDVVNPSRLRVGECMTVAILKDDIRIAKPDGTIDFEKTCERLSSMEEVLELAIKQQSDKQ